SLASEKRLKGKRWSFLLDKATKENWEDYKTKLDSSLKKKLNIIRDEHDLAYLESLNKDNLWDIIATSIIKCARSTLLGKKSTVGKPVTGKKRESRNIKKDLKIIRGMCQQCSSKI
ncbi:4412_t:CDS:1, partial [Scutellospora calospora]